MYSNKIYFHLQGLNSPLDEEVLVNGKHEVAVRTTAVVWIWTYFSLASAVVLGYARSHTSGTAGKIRPLGSDWQTPWPYLLLILRHTTKMAGDLPFDTLKQYIM